MTVGWRDLLEAAREPPTPAQEAWDEHWKPINEQGLRRGLSPGLAGLRALRLTEARYGPRPEAKETK